MATSTADFADNPFPGLRSFTPAESEVFFGREQQIADLLRRLNEVPLIAVAGTSGCGKSSLVLAGLLRALAARRAAGAPIEWRPVIMRPGKDPIANLARPLAAVLASGAALDADRVAALGGRLRLGAAGLAEAARVARLPPDVRLLVIVDQFEELFRYRRMTDAEDGIAFVKLLIEAANGADVAVSVVLTMRSDALGHCADFRDLAEAVSRGQFLVPRMTREQRKQAIVGPVRQRGFEIAPRLVQRLLNDVSDDFDDLPVMQHALASTWRRWAAACGGDRAVDVVDYEAIGTAEHALSGHADEAFDSLPDRAPLIERIFKALTEREGGPGSEVRHPVRFESLCAVVAAPPMDVAEVVDRYRRADTVFLLPPPDLPLAVESVVDVSHESLIRGWTRLTVWAEEEAQSAQSYRRLADAAALHAAGSGELLGDRALQFALEWRERAQPNAAWAARYAPDFERAMAFLDASCRAREARLAAGAQAALRRRRFRTVVFFGSMLLALLMSFQWWYSVQARNEAQDAQRKLADKKDEVLRQAESRKLALQSNELLAAGQLAPALLIGAASLHVRPNAEESQEVMRKALVDAPLRVLAGHQAPINGLAFAPHGKSLASVSTDGQAMLWDAGDGHLIAQVRDADAEPRATDDQRLGFDAQGALFVSSNASGAATLRDAAGVLRSLPLEAPPGGSAVQALAAEAGLFASTDLNGDVLRWNLKTGQKLPTLHAHGHDITSIAISPSGHYLAVAYPDSTLRLWDLAATPPTHRLLTGHTDAVNLVAFSPDDATLASASVDKTIVLWDVRRGTRQRRLVGHDAQVSQLAFSADGSLLASGGWDGAGIVWQVASGALGWRLDKGHRGQITSLAFSPDKRNVASGGVDKTVVLWDIATRNVDPVGHALKAHRGQVDRLTFSDDGQRLASAGRDKTVVLWDVSGQGVRHGTFMPSLDPITAIAFDPSGTHLALASENSTVRIWDVARGVLDPTVLLADDDILMSVAFSPDGRWIAAASDVGEGGEPSNVRVWNLASGAPIDQRARQHAELIGALAFGPDKRTLASASRDGAVMLWDLVDGGARRLPAAHHVAGLAFNPMTRRLATGGWEEAKTRTDTATDIDTDSGRGRGRGRDADADADADARLTAKGQDKAKAKAKSNTNINTVIVWDLDTTQPALPKIDFGANVVRAIAYTPDGKTLIVASSDGRETGSIRFFDAKTGTEDGPALEQKRASRIAIDPTGRLLVVGGLDGAIRLWDLKTRQGVGQPFVGHDGAVFSVSFRPDGRTIASAGQDRKVVLWDAEVERWYERACRIVDPDIDTDGWPASARAALAGRPCPR